MPNIDRNTDPHDLAEEFLASHGRPGQDHYIAETDETGLGAVDAVKDESAPSSQWAEAWRYLRKRPLFWVARSEERRVGKECRCQWALSHGCELIAEGTW